MDERTPGIRQVGILLAGLGAFSGCRTPPPPTPSPEPSVQQKALPPEVAQAIPPTRSIDNRPYELIWSPRREIRDALIDFEFVLGWSAEAGSGLSVSFDRSQEQQLWGKFVGKLGFHGLSENGRIDLRPPEPIKMNKHFDSVNLWVYGHAETEDRAGPHLWIQVEDAAGKVFDIELGKIEWGEWGLVHTKISPAMRSAVEHPCSFVGFRFEGCQAEQEIAYYLDSLSFYTESLGALAIPDLPRPNLPPEQAPALGLRGGGESLPFPIVEDTVLPPAGSERRSVEIVQADRAGIAWTSQGGDGALGFRFDPASLADGVEILWKDESAGRILVGSGVRSGATNEPQLTVVRSERDGVYVAYDDGLSIQFWVRGRSLVVDMRRRGGGSSGYDLGCYAGPREWREVDVPGVQPLATVGWLEAEDGSRDPLFISAAVDGYRSNATEIYGTVTDDDPVTSWGGVRYRARTDDQRLDLQERVVVTVAPELDDVLPAVANPPGAFTGELAERIWVDSSGPASYEEELTRTLRLGGWGITNVLQCHLQACWQDGFESSTLRTNAAPRRGGDAALQSFLQAQQDAGWWTALYMNPTQIHPLNANWREDVLLRGDDGAWVEGVPAHYRTKAPLAVALQNKLSRVVTEKFGQDATYVHALTAEAPWNYVDFDARVPGAGSLAQALYGVGELLSAEEEAVLGDGGMEGMYAGLMDGFLVQHDERMMRPYLPLFYLQRLAPLAVSFGAGDVLKDGDWGVSVDRAMAAQLAYGSLGRLAPEAAGPLLQCRSYYAMLPIQRRYAGRIPNRIAYWSGEHFLNTSEAIVSGHLARSQIYLLYEDVLEVWVNGSATEDWEVRVGRDQWILPPYGWVAVGPDLLAVSARIGEGRVDYVEDRGTVYYDGRGRREPFRDVASATPLVVHRDGSGVSVHDLTGGGMLAVGESLGVAEERSAEIMVTSGEGEGAIPHPFEWCEGMLLIRGETGVGERYRIEVGEK